MSSSISEEHHQTNADETLAQSLLIVVLPPIVKLVLQQTFGNGLSLLHGHLCQTHLLPAVPVDKVEQGDNDEHRRQYKDDEDDSQYKQHACNVVAIQLVNPLID